MVGGRCFWYHLIGLVLCNPRTGEEPPSHLCRIKFFIWVAAWLSVWSRGLVLENSVGRDGSLLRRDRDRGHDLG